MAHLFLQYRGDKTYDRMKKDMPDKHNQPPHLRKSIEDRDLNEDEQHQITNKGKEGQKKSGKQGDGKKERKSKGGRESKPRK